MRDDWRRYRRPLSETRGEMRGIGAGGVHVRVRGCQDPLLRDLDLQHLLGGQAGRVSGGNSLLLRDVDLGAYLRHCLTIQLSPCSVIVLSGLWRGLPLSLLRLGKRNLRLSKMVPISMRKM